MDNDGLVNGLFFKMPHPNAPDFVKGKLSINLESFREWLKSHISANPGEEWINMDVKISQGGKPYIAVDNWKPESAQGGVDDDDLPF